MMPEMLTAGEVVDGVPAAGRRWQEAGATSVCVALCVMDMNVSPLPPGVEVEGLLLWASTRAAAAAGPPSIKRRLRFVEAVEDIRWRPCFSPCLLRRAKYLQSL
jgi:hypothetical protein